MARFSLLCCLIAGTLGAASLAKAGDTVRFETNAGDFDVWLNPNDNPDLQPLVDNFLLYVESGRYVGAVINRAVTNFVVQMASFRTDDYDTANMPAGGLPQVEQYPAVVVDANSDGDVDFDTTGLSNTRGEVALALAAGNPNSGTASFFVNLGNNSFLDSQNFIPFARINDLSFMDQLEAGAKLDLSTEAGQPGSLAYTDVPVVGGDQFVVIEQSYVLPEPSGILGCLSGAMAMAARRRRRRC